MILVLFIVITFLSFVSCTQNNVRPSRQADLVVEYDGQVISASGPTWTSYEELVSAIDNEEESYVLFAAEWCKPCVKLLKIARQEGWMDKIHVINTDLPWVQFLMKETRTKDIPTLFVLGDGGLETKKVLSGPNAIITYLVVHL